MDAIREYLAMGGYAAFVWPAFGVTAIVMVVLLVVSIRGLRKERRTLELMESARPRRRDRVMSQSSEPATGSKEQAAGEA
jgi:heme exporter protein D